MPRSLDLGIQANLNGTRLSCLCTRDAQSVYVKKGNLWHVTLTLPRTYPDSTWKDKWVGDPNMVPMEYHKELYTV